MTIAGRNLTSASGAQPLVLFDMQAARIASSTPSTIVVTVPTDITAGSVSVAVGATRSNTIRFIDDAPAIVTLPPEQAEVGRTYQYRVGARDGRDRALAFQLAQAPGGAAFDATARAVTWLPEPGQGGRQELELVVSNGTHTARQRWTVMVRETIAEVGGTTSQASALELTVDRDASPLAGAQVTIPAGATGSPVAVRLSSALGDGMWRGVPRLKAEPSGTTFSQPARITLPLTDGLFATLGVPPTADLSLVSLDEATGSVEELQDVQVDLTRRVISGSTLHFSEFAVVAKASSAFQELVRLLGYSITEVTQLSLNSRQPRRLREWDGSGWVGCTGRVRAGERTCLVVHGILSRSDEFADTNDVVRFAKSAAAGRYDRVLAYDYPSAERVIVNARGLLGLMDVEEGAEFDIIAHSMGGLVARAAVEADDGADGKQRRFRRGVRRVLTLATPHRGSRLGPTLILALTGPSGIVSLGDLVDENNAGLVTGLIIRPIWQVLESSVLPKPACLFAVSGDDPKFRVTSGTRGDEVVAQESALGAPELASGRKFVFAGKTHTGTHADFQQMRGNAIAWGFCIRPVPSVVQLIDFSPQTVFLEELRDGQAVEIEKVVVDDSGITATSPNGYHVTVRRTRVGALSGQVRIHARGSSVTIPVRGAAVNVPPVADAGLSQQGVIGRLVTLDGSQSKDADVQDTLTYSWRSIGTPAASLGGASTARPTFTPSAAGTYVFELVVGDGKVTSAPATVVVTVPQPPAGAPTPLSPGTLTSPGPMLATPTQTFSWSAVAGASRYGLYVRDLGTNGVLDPTDPLVVNNETLTGTSFQVAALVPGHAYRWNVACFQGTAASAPSSRLYFQVAPTIVPVITSATTANGTQETSFSYQIVASNTPTSFGATSLPAGLSVNSATGVISGTPTVNGTFTVSLSATNAAGTGTSSLTLTLAAPASNSPPNTPSISMPSDNATDIVVNPTVGGSTYNDPDGDAHQSSTWEVYDNASLGSSNLVWSKANDTTNKTDIDVNTSTGTFANALSGQSKLANNTAYFARVKYTDGRGAPSSFSAASKFTTTAAPNNAPATPSITSPANNATGIAINPTLQASTFSDPDSDLHASSTWEVYDNVSLGSGNLVWTKVGDTSNKTSIVVNSSNGVFSNALAGRTALTGDTAYFVRVKYTDSHGAASSFSTPARLTTIPSGWIAPYLPAQSGHAMAYDSARARVVLFGSSNNTWESDGTTWTQIQPATSPPARSYHAMAYDSARARVVLFGGYTGSFLSDTWGWDGTTWTQRQPSTSPPARYLHAMAYDSARGRVVLFGGYNGTSGLSDTWEWDGTTWTQSQPTTSPPARASHAMAYDSARGRVVLFGGYGSSNLSDTWEWDGTTWTQSQPTASPLARAGHAMAYDSDRGRVVLFGGGSGLSDTWEWDGTTWTQREPTASPPARYGHAMAYDSDRGRVVLFGGYTASFLSDTWEWDGTTWTQRQPTASPPARFQHAMAYDSARGRMVLFGGYGTSPLSDTWEWDGTTWTQSQPAASPPARSQHAMAYDSARDRVVLFGGSGLSDTWEWDGTTWTQSQPSTSPQGRGSHAMAYDSTRGRVVLFGGSWFSTLSDTWEWDGTTWTQSQPTASPPARFNHAMAYDSARGRVVLFGGQPGGSSRLSDTWEWDGTTWTQRQPFTSPPSRGEHAMAYDSARGRVVLFGGSVPIIGSRPGTWEWNGSTWTERQPTTSPPLRDNHAMAYDSARGRVVLFGGGPSPSDTWEWDGN